MRPPIIVGGNPRSGTTFVAAMLNEHADVVITSEMNPKAARLMVEMMHQLTRYMGRKAHRARYWRRKRPRLQLEIWRATTSDVVYKDKAADAVMGHKTPGVELLFDDYVRIFEPAARPRLVYCLRDGLSVLRSVMNMPWAPVSFEERLDEYKHSVATFEALRERYPDDVYLLQIDAMPDDADARVDALRPMFTFLDVALTRPVEDYIRDWAPRNTRADVAGDTRPTELTAGQLAVLASDAEFMAIQRRYGYELPRPPAGARVPWRVRVGRARASATDLGQRGGRRAHREAARVTRYLRTRR